VCNQQTDKRLLGAMVEQETEVKKALGIEEKSDMVADAGYFNETDVLANQQGRAIRVTVPLAAEGEREDTKKRSSWPWSSRDRLQFGALARSF